jgi:hypothetical protein
MNADFPVILDACVLANQRVTDLLLRLAETPRLYLPHWSNRLLDETDRTLRDELKWASLCLRANTKPQKFGPVWAKITGENANQPASSFADF